ncbi:Phosphatidylinositol transfer protein SFH5 [Candida viswanathii]|uniref:Phosphatidylinositol transfer protein SFH5 n=1 Tax=Candida viswanathii TaxID=5486 RepID=A0A367YDK3_9ASCO|nr:Phosphatidylinositol transfer protein SFH5 [Candida viswanathii]
MATPVGDIKSTIKSTDLEDEQAEKLAALIEAIPEILSKADNPEYDEIFGHRINTSDKPEVNEPIRNEILLKFLAADKYDLDLAKERVLKTFNWRNGFQPLSAAFDEQFDEELNELGVVTDFPKSRLHVATWNLYGNLKNPKKVFEKFGGNNKNVELPGSQFLRWRIGLMEKSLQLIDFTSKDNNKVAQVHDYNNVSFWGIDPGMKQATNEIIAIFGDNYPELLSTKFFINVPLLMGWVFTFFKTIGMISQETLNKFQILNHGDMLEFFSKSELPKDYGGELDETLFTLSVEKLIKLSEYGEVVLQKSGEASKVVEEPQASEDDKLKGVDDEVE